MRIVITGGTGLIGRALVADLVKDGHEVTILSRSPEKHRATFSFDVSVEHWDARTVGDWAQLVDGTDAVVNLAGESIAGYRFFPERWTEDKKHRIRDSRLNAGHAVVEAIKMAGKKPRVLLQASAVGYYGPTGDEVITESSPPGDDYLALTAIEWEATTSDVESMGVRRVITRTGLILTTEGGPLPRLMLPYKLYGGGYFGSGRQYYPWIHMEDKIRAMRFLLETESASGPFNLTAPNPVTGRDFGKALGKAMGKPSYLPVPAFAMDLAFGEVTTVVLAGQHAVPKKLKELGFNFTFDDVEEALLDLLNG